MKANKTYLLAVIFVVLAVIAYFITTDRGEKTSTYKLEKQLFAVDSAAVDKIELEHNGKKTTLVKSGPQWIVTQPVEYSAYQQFIGSALSDLKNYKLESKVSDNPNNKERYGFSDTNTVKVSVYQGGNLMGTLLVGNASSGPSQTFIKKTELNEIFLANDFLRSNFAKENINDWRDKLICAISKGSIKSIEFISAADNYKIEKDSAGIFHSGKDSVNSQQAEGLGNLFQNYNTQGFKDTTISDNVKFDYLIKVTADKVYTFGFLKAGEGNNPKYLLKFSDKKQIFEVDENFLKMAFKTKKEMVISK
jgi:hypothetical protein